ncbi:MAG: hypothetical protein ABJN04_10530 [Hyphomicrobiales bacterium]
MWDFSSRLTQGHDGHAQDCVSQTITSLKTYENDALMIARRIDKQIKSAVKKQHMLLTATNEIGAEKMRRRLCALQQRKKQAKNYIKRIQRLQSTEALVNECKRSNIDPSLRIVFGGGTLKHAADELARFLDEPTLFQEFDRDYDLN